MTFDPAAAVNRDDVVLAHLNHPLVAMSTGLLRAAVSQSDTGLHRVTAVLSDDPVLEDVLVGAFSRFVLVGADGVRLHEEVLHAGGWMPERGRFRRWENLGALRGVVSRALADGVPAPPHIHARLAERWPAVRDGVLAAIDWRTNARERSLERVLAERAQEEQERIADRLDRFAQTLRRKLAEEDTDLEQALISRAEVGKSRDELAQYRRDRRSWAERLDQLPQDRERELAAVSRRYADPQPHRFPVAVVFVVPRREAVR